MGEESLVNPKTIFNVSVTLYSSLQFILSDILPLTAHNADGALLVDLHESGARDVLYNPDQ